jgi:DNA-binding MarR family transcriptional regulator
MGLKGTTRAGLRAAVLNALYALPGGSWGDAVEAEIVASRLGLDPVAMDRILDELVARKLVTRLIGDGHVRLTDRGVDSVEGTADPSAPEGGTKLVIHSQSVGGIQVNSTNSPQYVHMGFADDLRPIVTDLRAAIAELHLGLQDRERLEHEVAVIDRELSSATPRPDATARALKSIRRLLQGTAEATAGAVLAPEVVKVLELLEHALRLIPH